MGNLLVYPISKDSISILRHRNIISRYDKIYGATLKADWREGEDISYVDNGDNINYFAEWDFEKLLEMTEEVLFSKLDSKVDMIEFFRPKVEICLKKNKKFGFSFILDQEQREKLQAICGQTKYVTFLEEWDNPIDCNKPLHSIDVPVIFICGLGEATDKFELQLLLREKLLQDHFKITQIGSKQYSTLFGFHAIPDFMFESELSEKEKIMKFNDFVYEIQKKEAADLILIGLPLGLLRKSTNNFAILPYEISAALTPDYVFLCAYYEIYYDEYLSELIENLNSKFDFEVNQFIISNTYIDKSSEDIIKQEYLKVPGYQAEQLVDQLKASFDLIPVNSLCRDMDTIYQTMLSELIDNTEFTIL